MKKYFISALLVVLPVIAIWIPFYLKITNFWGLDFSEGMSAIWRNYDGPNYLIVAKTFYNKTAISTGFSNPLPAEYYAAHFPLYPTVISVLSTFVRGPWAMLLATQIGNVLMIWAFLMLLAQMKLDKKWFWLILVLSLLPARLLIVRSVGSPESWFNSLILFSILAFKKKRYLLSGILGALAQLTKSPGIILFGAYGIYLLLEQVEQRKFDAKKLFRAWPLLLMPLSLLGLFWFFKVQTGDFFAYFHSGDNFHLFWPPFSIFSPKGQFWTGDFWLEEVIWTWLVYGIGISKLWKDKFKLEAIFGGLFFLATLFVAHRDVARYILPIAPLALIGWRKLIDKKEFKLLAVILALPIFLFAWGFILKNQAPIADWAPYL